LTFVLALGCSTVQIKQALSKPLIFVLVLLLAHGAAPLLAYGTGVWIFGADSPYVIGLVLFTIIPLGVSSVIWVGMAGGNTAFMIPMIVLDSMLSPLLVPLLISWFFQQHLSIDPYAMMKDLMIIIVIPTLVGVLMPIRAKAKIKDKLSFVMAPTSKLSFISVIIINAAVIAPFVKDMKGDLMILIPVTIGLVVVGYILGYVGSLWLKSKEMMITLTYAIGMRNISLGIVLAITYFEPLTAVPVILSILLQQPMAALFLRLQKNNKSSASS
jgi:BASS family bile acid:Na+ symporter